MRTNTMYGNARSIQLNVTDDEDDYVYTSAGTEKILRYA